MKRQSFPIANIYVPVKRRATLNTKTVDDIAESILEVGLKTPILVRRETTIFGFLVEARKH
jgi:ParB-like chromosome segregation protein Spo0J